MQNKILSREWVIIALVIGVMVSIGSIAWLSRVKSENSLANVEKIEKPRKIRGASSKKKRIAKNLFRRGFSSIKGEISEGRHKFLL
jgi:hypothetical protein